MLSVSHGHGPPSPMMSTMSGQHGKLNPSSSMAGGSPNVKQKLSTSRGTRQRGGGPPPISDNGPPLPPRNKK